MAESAKKGRVVIALGGNALKKPKEKGTFEEMFANVDTTTKQIATVLERGYEIVLTHGNGPQVGGIFLQNQLGAKEVEPMPLFVCGAESQGMLGFLMQQSLHNELIRRKSPFASLPIVTVVSQFIVDPEDPLFKKPSKPIGKFYTKEEAMAIHEKEGKAVKEDSGRGWRVVVPSPLPQHLVEADAVRTLLKSGAIVIASGGGGIPVTKDKDGILKGIDAVIDKDLAGEKLAEVVEADLLIILTDVDAAYTDYTKPEKKAIPELTVARAKELLAKGEFAAGSMGPKVQAAVNFVDRTKKMAIITSLEKAIDSIDGKAGTRILP